MVVTLSSNNPVKVHATRTVISKIFGDVPLQIVSVSVDVPAQPIGDLDTQEGAYKRACAAIEQNGCDLGIGLEGGLRETIGGWALCSWAAVVDRFGRTGLGCSGVMLLPTQIAERVIGGEELGRVMDDLTNHTGTNKSLGASGFFTKGLIDRQAVFEDALTYALTPWLHPSHYPLE
jgi:inosine/xanthosine triphosphatase